MSSSNDKPNSPDLCASSSKDPPPPLESGQAESDGFTTPKKFQLQSLRTISPVKGITPKSDFSASSSKDHPLRMISEDHEDSVDDAR